MLCVTVVATFCKWYPFRNYPKYSLSTSLAGLTPITLKTRRHRRTPLPVTCGIDSLDDFVWSHRRAQGSGSGIIQRQAGYHGSGGLVGVSGIGWIKWLVGTRGPERRWQSALFTRSLMGRCVRGQGGENWKDLDLVLVL